MRERIIEYSAVCRRRRKASDFVDLLSGVRPGIVDGHCNIRELCAKCALLFIWDGDKLIKREDTAHAALPPAEGTPTCPYGYTKEMPGTRHECGIHKLSDYPAISAGRTGQPEENNAYSVDSSAGDNPVSSSDGDNSRQVLSPAPQLREENERLKQERGPQTVEDGFGSSWPPCEKHNMEMQVMRPGDARCHECETEDYIDRLNQELDHD